MLMFRNTEDATLTYGSITKIVQLIVELLLSDNGVFLDKVMLTREVLSDASHKCMYLQTHVSI